MENLLQGFPARIIQSIPLEEDRFGFDQRSRSKIAKRCLRVYEVGISYSGRTYEEARRSAGKMVFRAIWCLVKFSLKEPRAKRGFVAEQSYVRSTR